METNSTGIPSERDELHERTESFGKLLSEKASELGKELRELGKLALDATEYQFERLQEEGETQVHKVVEEIKERPLSSLFVATCMGLLIGYMLRPSAS